MEELLKTCFKCCTSLILKVRVGPLGSLMNLCEEIAQNNN